MGPTFSGAVLRALGSSRADRHRASGRGGEVRELPAPNGRLAPVAGRVGRGGCRPRGDRLEFEGGRREFLDGDRWGRLGCEERLVRVGRVERYPFVVHPRDLRWTVPIDRRRIGEEGRSPRRGMVQFRDEIARLGCLVDRQRGRHRDRRRFDVGEALSERCRDALRGRPDPDIRPLPRVGTAWSSLVPREARAGQCRRGGG